MPERLTVFGTYRTYLALLVVVQHIGGIPVIGGYAVFGFYILSGYLMTLIMIPTATACTAQASMP